MMNDYIKVKGFIGSKRRTFFCSEMKKEVGSEVVIFFVGK